MKQYNKNIFLIIAFILVGILAYKYSFAKTFTVKAQLEELEEKIENNSTYLARADLETQMTYLDSIITRNRNSGISLQNSLLKVLNENSSRFSYKIMAFKEPHSYTWPESVNKTDSFEFTLEGDYKNMEEIIHTIERNYSFGTVAHISFRKEKDYRQNEFFLQGRIIIQNVN